MIRPICPVLRHHEWRLLLRDFVSSQRFLEPYQSGTLRAALTPVVSLAWWMTERIPAPARGKPLHVVILGAGERECTDHGRWLSFLPWFLGRTDLQVSFTLVGNQLTGPANVFGAYPGSLSSIERAVLWASDAADAVVTQQPATFVDCSRRQGRPADIPAADLYALFVPESAATYVQWLGRGNLLPWLADQVPTAVFAPSRLEGLCDRLLLGQEDPPSIPAPMTLNPWRASGKNGEAERCFAHYAWGLDTQTVVAPREADDALFAQVHASFSFLGPLVASGHEVDIPAFGSELVLSVAGEVTSPEMHRVFRLPGDMAVRAETGEVGTLSGGEMGPLDQPLTVPMATLAQRPVDASMRQILWAVDAYRNFVVGRIDAAAPSTAQETGTAISNQWTQEEALGALERSQLQSHER